MNNSVIQVGLLNKNEGRGFFNYPTSNKLLKFSAINSQINTIVSQKEEEIVFDSDDDTFPASIEKAIKHEVNNKIIWQKASKIGMLDDENSEKCECCDNPINVSSLSLCKHRSFLN